MNTEIFYLINNNMSNPLFDLIMPVFGYIGGFAGLSIICLIALIVSRKNIRKLGKYYPLVKLCCASLLITAGLCLILKLGFSQTRPYLVLPHINVLAQSVDPNSFPSGHTASTVSIMSIIVIKSKEYFEKYRLVSSLAVIFALLVAFSRVYVGMHYPLDVFCGALMAMIVAFLVSRYLKV